MSKTFAKNFSVGIDGKYVLLLLTMLMMDNTLSSKTSSKVKEATVGEAVAPTNGEL